MLLNSTLHRLNHVYFLIGRFAAACPATPRKGAAERATSQPPESAPDEKLRKAAARHAMSARLPDVRAVPS